MTATLPFIQQTFDTFNAQCFEGVLPPVPIILTKAKSFLGKMEYRSVRGLFGLVSSNKDFRMKISTSFDLPEEELEDVVLHEMIHYYIAWRGIRDTSVHGETFRSIMKQLNGKFGRNITVRHKSSGGSQPEPDTSRPGRRFVCITSFADGSRGVTVAATTKVLALHRYFSRCPDIKGIRWYSSSDPFFDRYPRSRTPKVYRIAQDEIGRHLVDSMTFDCDGRTLIPLTGPK